MKRLICTLFLSVSLWAADDKPVAPTVEQLQQTVDAQAKLIDWLKAEFTALQAQLQATNAYFQSVLNLQQLDKQKPPEPKALDKAVATK